MTNLHYYYLHCVINKRWPDVNSNVELLDKTNQKPIQTQIKDRKRCWIGLALRKPNKTI
jgi:hypothetical protein